jgi:hypothetical protein
MMLSVKERASPDEADPPIVSLVKFTNQEEVCIPQSVCVNLNLVEAYLNTVTEEPLHHT